MSLINIAFVISILCYLLAGGIFTQKFFKKSEPSFGLAQVMIMLALLAHLAVLVLSSLEQSSEQLTLSFVATMLVWVVSLTTLISHRFINNLLFLPIVSFASAFILFVDLFSPTTTGIAVDMSIGMISHIMLSLLAFGLLSISMFYACQLAYINYQLKQKSRIMLDGHLPPLMAVEQILYKLMTLGTGILLFALVSGFLFVPNMLAEGYAHKTVLSSIALLSYLACIVLHHFVGLRARVTVVYNFAGLLLLTLAYFGSRFVKEVLLN